MVVPANRAAGIDGEEAHAQDIDRAVRTDRRRRVDLWRGAHEALGGARHHDAPSLAPVGVYRVEPSVVGRDVDRAVRADRRRRPDPVPRLELPSRRAVGVDRMQGIIVPADVDRAVARDRGRGKSEGSDGGLVGPPDLALGIDRVDVAPAGHVDGPVRSDSGDDEILSRPPSSIHRMDPPGSTATRLPAEPMLEPKYSVPSAPMAGIPQWVSPGTSTVQRMPP